MDVKWGIPTLAMNQNKHTAPLSFKGFGETEGTTKITWGKLGSLQRLKSCCHLCPYLLSRNIDGSFSAPKGGTLIRAPAL